MGVEKEKTKQNVHVFYVLDFELSLKVSYLHLSTCLLMKIQFPLMLSQMLKSRRCVLCIHSNFHTHIFVCFCVCVTSTATYILTYTLIFFNLALLPTNSANILAKKEEDGNSLWGRVSPTKTMKEWKQI